MIVFNIVWNMSRVAEDRKKANETCVIIERDEGSFEIVCSNQPSSDNTGYLIPICGYETVVICRKNT